MLMELAIVLIVSLIIMMLCTSMTMGMRPTPNAERNPIQATRNVAQRVNWRSGGFGMGFWKFPVMKRFLGPKWKDVTDAESATGDPPNMNSDKIILDANTPFFSIRMTKSFYCTMITYLNGQWQSSRSYIWEYTPDSKTNWLYWDENDVAYATANGYVVEYIIDNIPGEGDNGE